MDQQCFDSNMPIPGSAQMETADCEIEIRGHQTLDLGHFLPAPVTVF